MRPRFGVGEARGSVVSSVSSPSGGLPGRVASMGSRERGSSSRRRGRSADVILAGGGE